ncbi:hypothetical protein [Sphingomonas turrisvirgatae]|uniref:hypothetical protein n=1 Tax=Sphingomonas turrisvirgatae TaxID=1888892 RepID=UPI0013013BD9|nr:hypothetical protein [Sphingomonas turrisvirgatae]
MVLTEGGAIFGRLASPEKTGCDHDDQLPVMTRHGGVAFVEGNVEQGDGGA